MDKIDNLDRKILSIIIGNARIPSKDVGSNAVFRVRRCISGYSV